MAPDISIKVADYPFLINSFIPEITAESALIMDDTSKVILYEKNPLLRFSMASTTKIMTALVALDHFADKDILTVHSAHTEGAVVGFSVGEKIFFKDMLYGLLLPSGNDAAYAIAENYPGGTDAFVSVMNNKARLLHLFYTNYADPAGLDDDGNYTVVRDLAHLASYAIKNPEFAEIIATKQEVITNVDGSKRYALSNLNKLLGYNGVTGIKTGSTEGAGEVLVTSKVEKGHVFIVVVMRSQDRFGDTRRLLGLISDNVNYLKLEDLLLPGK